MAGKGGGAWKVAYADFVTAMMAFFLVMWICGQDQKVRRAVSYYFMDPFSASIMGSKKPTRAGSLSESPTQGNVPHAESVSMGPGRNSYTTPAENSAATKVVSDWLVADPKTNQYWRDQVRYQRESAQQAAGTGRKTEAAEKVATRKLAQQLKNEITRGVPQQGEEVYKDLLKGILAEVNWTEIAEDLMVSY